ncbi:MAG: carboxypeptidase regulatory-like domain-containing protein [Bryobacterales bacterium]|nr:carboxypeptidase regulatory-like domain-containing protein [Bryobacterales bacterium]
MPVNHHGAAACIALLLAGACALAGTMIRVIDAETGAPLSGARVELSTTGEVRLAVWTIETDSDGTARLEADGSAPPRDSGAAVYRVTAAKEGYTDFSRAGSEGRLLVVTRGAENRVLIALERAAAISGTVTDGAGTALSGMWVAAIPQTAHDDAFRAGELAAEAITDDRGRYRLHSLPPGEYRIAAEPRGQSVSSRLRGVAYYPQATTFAEAQPLRLAPGSELHSADIRFTESPRGSLQGMVSGIPAEWRVGGAAIALVPKGGVRVPVAATSTEPGGQFAIGDIPAGEYVVLAWGPLSRSGYEKAPQDGPALYASADVTVDGGSVREIQLALSPGPRVYATLPKDRRCSGAAVLQMTPEEPWFPSWTLEGRTVAGGIEWPSVPPGTYRFTMPRLDEICAFPGVIAAGETSPRPLLRIDGPAAVSAVVAPWRGTVSGTVRFRGAAPPAAVLLLWSLAGETSRATSASNSGGFQFNHVPPGRYRISARFAPPGEGSATPGPPFEIQRQLELADGEQAAIELSASTEVNP